MKKVKNLDMGNFLYAVSESVQEGIWSTFLQHMERFGYSEDEIEKVFEQFRKNEGVS